MDSSIRYISPVGLSQIYPTLKQMTAQELITFQIEKRTSKPDLKIYSITETGLALFRQWLAEPYKPDPYRFDSFTLRFYFSSMLDRSTLLNHIRAELTFRQIQLEAAQNFNFNNLGDLNLKPAGGVDMERTVKFWGLYHQYGLQFMETYTRWLARRPPGRSRRTLPPQRPRGT